MDKFFDDKFQIAFDLDGQVDSNNTNFSILDSDGNVIDDEPLFTKIDLSLRADKPIMLRAELYGDHLKSRVRVTVGTIAAFTDEELAEEITRRCEKAAVAKDARR